MRLIKYILLVCTISAGLLSALVVFYRKGQSQFFKVEQPVKEMLSGTENFDVLFLGSSRMSCHVNPFFVDSITQLNSYNAGHSGFNIIEMNLMLQCYLERHIPPKVVVADFAINAFDTHHPIYSPVDYFEYMYDRNVANVMLKYHERAHLWKYLPFMQLCEADEMQKVQAVMGLLGKKERLGGYRGYTYNEGVLMPPFGTYNDESNFTITPDALKILDHLIATCSKNKTKLIFTYSPEFYLVHHKSEARIVASLQAICNANNIPFLNYRQSELCRQNALFADPLHLNTKGAEVYSKVLACDINKYVKDVNSVHSAYYTTNDY